MKRKRLDELLIERGHFEDLAAALGPIMAGDVRVGGAMLTKAGGLVAIDADIVVRGQDQRFASRGGLKLERALDVFGINVAGKIALDAGASTGGFTDCLLQRGARRVYAVDVGYGQLRGRLAVDPRVVVLEKTNVSDLVGSAVIPEPIDLCTLDLSYLSLTRAGLILRDAVGQVDLVCLAKPLYEGLKEADKASMAAILTIMEAMLTKLAEDGLYVRDVIVSPVLGGRGAVECLIHVVHQPQLTIAQLIQRLREDWTAHPPI
jgi:23S rRNA (cytidine1920-2'-O)/16S rRNA (cytidine1409-2'-O)-methyltransferase